MNPTFQDILIVDDDRTVRTSLSHALKTAGFRVRTAADGAEALQVLRQECPYFVITDWRMTPIDGIELCRRLRQEILPHYVYVVLMTMKPDRNDIVAGFGVGADDFVSKPVRSKELLARLEAGMRVLELEDRLCQLASVDSLTGMLNLRTAMQFLEKEWGRAIRYSHPLSCVMWDVDHFKPINDTHGHFVGDESLRSLSRLAESSCRRSDYMCRWGGDEFFVIMPETNEEGASCWAERLCSAIAGTGFSFRGQAMSITASFGVAERQEFMQSPKQMLDLVDHAMYEAKKAGRNRVVTARSVGHSTPDGTASVATELMPGAIPCVFASAGRTESAGYLSVDTDSLL